MIRPNRTILNRIRELSDNTSVRIITAKGQLANPETGKHIDCRNDYGKELSACLYGLVRDGYLTQLDEYHVALTDKGLHPYRQTLENIKHFLFHSIFVPVVVSLFTTLITIYTTS